MSSAWREVGIIVALAAVILNLSVITAQADERISDIRNTRHNFSAVIIPILPNGEQRSAYAASETQICVFCHTPHGATKAPKAPLWNRKLSGVTYIPYSSGSLQAIDLGQPRAKSKLCLSCHDGTLALGAVNVVNRVQNTHIPMTGPDIGAGGTIPTALGATTGFTRDLGINLTNDHPISFTYDSAQAARNGELYDPAAVTQVGNREPGQQTPPLFPLEDNHLECISCHDPHLRGTNGENIKFLRANRFQEAEPIAGHYNPNTDIMCMGCHNKAGIVDSAHLNPNVATYQFQDAAADLRQFPRDTQVWEAACLACHDPHTVQGAMRLEREGTDGPVGLTPEGAFFKYGGNPAVEQTCYACHSSDGNVLRNQSNRPGFGVPDIKTDFTLLPRHMPIAATDQPAGHEVHDIGTAFHNEQGGKDFMESQLLLGKGNLINRHAECTDCHNPHRVIRNRYFNADPRIPDAAGTHPYTAAQATETGGIHSNIASGVLRGIWGVEPSAWPSTAFGSIPTHFDVKRGEPTVGAPTNANAPYLTREYQLCFKCHSNYAYDTPPVLGSFQGGTPPGTNSLLQYTNQAMEYQSPNEDKGEVPVAGAELSGPTGAFSGRDAGGNTVNYLINNHRSWHPVMQETGRTPPVRKISNPNLWRAPFNNGVGIQTMYCTDCHGSNTNVADGIVPVGGENGNPWGPHGSTNDFILKGPWNDQTGTAQNNGLCFRCHNFNYYANPTPPGGTLPSGFGPAPGVSEGCLAPLGSASATIVNLHTGHLQQVKNFRCTYCHVSIPHGWKNKVFLVNLNDVGPEVGLPPGTQVRDPSPQRYYRGPYYNGAVLKVVNFQRSGEWTPVSCGSAGPPGNGLVGVSWMIGSTEACNNIP